MTTTTATANTSAATTNYALTLNDLAAWSNIVMVQAQASLAKTYTNAECSAFVNWNYFFTMTKVQKETIPGAWNIYDITPIYSLISNADLLKWMNDLFTQLLLLQVPAFNLHYYELFAAYARQNELFNQSQYLHPVDVAGWGTAVVAISTKWGTYFPDNLDNNSLNNADAWTNPPQLKTTFSVLWTDQYAGLKTLMQADELTSEQCMYLMWLLPSLISGTTDQQNSAQKIISATCNSIEQPNMNFYTSLVYYNLMQLADPLGDYAQPNPQILAIVNTLQSTITGTDPGSVAMVAALKTQAKILTVSANYPMVDPYNPAIGIPTGRPICWMHLTALGTPLKSA